MFGTVLPDRSRLNDAQYARYHSVYCGLCRTLQCEYGLAARMTLRYDMAFLILLLSSLYEPQEAYSQKRCLVHPFRKTPCVRTSFTSYAAAMNTALAYYKALDDWQDDKNPIALLQAKLLHPAVKKVQKRYPAICQTIEQSLSDLARLERKDLCDPDAAAACFGRLTGTLFAGDTKDNWTNSLYRLGDSLGRFIYLTDALLDLKSDLKKGRYNPLKGHAAPGEEDAFLPALQLTIGDCARELEHLPLVQDLDILRNIVYSGVWNSYTALQKKKQRSDTRV